MTRLTTDALGVLRPDASPAEVVAGLAGVLVPGCVDGLAVGVHEVSGRLSWEVSPTVENPSLPLQLEDLRAALPARVTADVRRTAAGSGGEFGWGDAVATVHRRGDWTLAVVAWRSGTDRPFDDRTVEVLSGLEATAIPLIAASVFESRLALHVAVEGALLDAVVALDADFRVVRWSDGAVSLYGIPADEALGLPMNDLITTVYDDPRWDTALAWEELQRSGHWRGQVTQTTRHGVTRSVLASVSLMRGEDGQITGAVSVNQDSSRVMAARGRVTLVESRLAAALEVAGDMAVVLDDDGVIVAANSVWLDRALEGNARMDRVSVGANYLSVLAAAAGSIPEADRARRRLTSVLAGESESERDSYDCALPTGIRVFEWEARRATHAGGAVVVHRDVTPDDGVTRGAGRSSAHDPLTGCPPRAALPGLIHRMLAGSSGPQLIGLAAMDIDRFASVNEALGYRSGDEVLRQIADRLRAVAGGAIALLRLGGDQFGLLSVGPSESELCALAEEAIHQVNQPITVGEHQVALTLTVGVASIDSATVEDAGELAAVLLSHADAARVQSRELGRNRLNRYTAELGTRTSSLLLLTHAFGRAMADGGLRLYLQQIRRTSDDRVVGFEGLVRWAHADGEVSGPAVFGEVLSAPGIAAPFARWTVDAAIEALGELHQRDPTLTVAMNMSARQLVEEDVERLVQSASGRTGIATSALTVEVTETEAFDDKRVRRALMAIREAGARVALDDFGTGFSSLAHLRALPVDIVKVDRSFVAAIGTDVSADALVRSLIGLGGELGLTVVAEGVEETHQLEQLRAWGCHEYQGFLAARPQPLTACLQALPPT